MSRLSGRLISDIRRLRPDKDYPCESTRQTKEANNYILHQQTTPVNNKGARRAMGLMTFHMLESSEGHRLRRRAPAPSALTGAPLTPQGPKGPNRNKHECAPPQSVIGSTSPP